MPYVYTYLHSRYHVRTCLQPPPSPACCQVLPEELCSSALGRGCRRAPIDRGLHIHNARTEKIRFDSSDLRRPFGRSDDWCRYGRLEGAVPLWFVLHFRFVVQLLKGMYVKFRQDHQRMERSKKSIPITVTAHGYLLHAVRMLACTL